MMKVLHVGWGFSPLCMGGAIEYSEDLMEIQVRHGYEIYYFCSGREYPFNKGPRLYKWCRENIKIYEIINSPVASQLEKGTALPGLDINEDRIEEIFRQVLREVRPDIIHIHEMVGLPSSLIEISKSEFKIPVVMTALSYYLLCPTVKLTNLSDQLCTNIDNGLNCSLCCKDASQWRFLIISTMIYELRRLHLYWLARSIISVVSKTMKHKISRFLSPKMDLERTRDNLSYQFKKRREMNIRRLRMLNMLISLSYKAENIYKGILGNDIHSVTLHGSLKHLDLIKPKEMKEVLHPIKFATLNGCASKAKGAQLIRDAMEILKKKAAAGKFQLHIYGFISDDMPKEFFNQDNVFYHGTYDVSQLDSILNTIDVGIVPSIWEEVYGYVGIEFLAKGIPVIGNNRGGITDYVTDGVTGWLNKSASAEELADIMVEIIRSPRKIVELNNKIVANRKELVKKMDQYFMEIDSIYKNCRQEYRDGVNR